MNSAGKDISRTICHSNRILTHTVCSRFKGVSSPLSNQTRHLLAQPREVNLCEHVAGCKLMLVSVPREICMYVYNSDKYGYSLQSELVILNMRLCLNDELIINRSLSPPPPIKDRNLFFVLV
jgi:hypothetical protein